MLYANRRPRIETNRVEYIQRDMFGKGKINVRVGQEVTPDDILATTSSSGGYRSLHLSNLLSVPPQEVKKYLQRPVGQRIYKGELLAFKSGGLLGGKKVVVAPSDGVIESLNDRGELRMSFLPTVDQLPAAVYGIVDEVDEARQRILIRTEATKIFGLFGSGKAAEGILTVLGVPSDIIRASKISPKLSGEILVGGGLIDKEAISAAVSDGVKGIISGGINASDYRAITGGNLSFPNKIGSDIGISILITEGFGSIPIGEDLWESLKKFDGSFALLDGNGARLSLPSTDQDCMMRIRKTKLPKPELADKTLGEVNKVEAKELSLGLKVRVIASPFMGEQGKLVSIDNMPTKLLSGITTYLVVIETRSRKIKVPYSNIEII